MRGPVKRPVPPYLHAYQVQDVQRMYEAQSLLNNLRMGSGKTLEALCVIQRWIDDGVVDMAVVVAPKSVLRLTWGSEIETHMPALQYTTITGDLKPSERGSIWSDVLGEWGNDLDILLTNPAMLQSAKDHRYLQGLMGSRRVALLCDEAHMLSNTTTRLHETWCGLRAAAHRVILMTATPVTRNPMDLYGLMNAAGYPMGSKNEFIHLCCTTQSVRVPAPQTMKGFLIITVPTGFLPVALPWVSEIMKKRTIYRPPEELPVSLQVIDIGIEMTPVEREAYNAAANDGASGGMRAIHGMGDDDTGALDVAVDRFVNKYLGEHGAMRNILSGKVAAPKRAAKDQRVVDLLPELTQSGGVVIYSPYRESMYRLHDVLCVEFPLWKFTLLTGRQNLQEREQAVRQLQDDPGTVCMLMTDAGAEGLNLQGAASVIVLFDRLYIPAREDQVIGRVYRQGQQRNCLAVRFNVLDTIDDDLLVISARRRRLMELVDSLSTPADPAVEVVR